MDLRPSLEVLGVDNLADLTLEELRDKIVHIPSSRLPGEQVLQIFMNWLHERIKKDIQQKSLLAGFVGLLLDGGKLQREPFNENEVETAFKEWQTKDAEEGPANRRRYQMVEQDLNEIFKRARNGLNLEDDSSEKLSSLDQHESDLADSSDKGPPCIVGGGRQKTGSNEIPLGQRKTSRENIHQKILKIKEDNKKKSQVKASAKDASSFDRTASTSLENTNLRGRSPVRAHMSSVPDSKPNMHQQLAGPPPRGYICKRCDAPGHWIQTCPTNLDARFDKPPPRDYRCDICKVWGDHFATLCPRNENDVSLTQQRKRYDALLEVRSKKSTRDVKSRYRERGSLSPIPRRRSRSPSRSSSPGPIEFPRRERDDSRIDARSRVRSPDRDRRRKRDATRNSLSPWSARERITREQFRTEERPRKSSTSSYRPRRAATPSRERRYIPVGTSPFDEPSRPFKEPKGKNEVNEVNEGRLAYDNDVFVDFDISPETPKQPACSEPESFNASKSEDEAMVDPSLVARGTLEDIERAGKEADEFLDSLAVEIFASDGQARSVGTGLVSDESILENGATDQPDDGTSINKENEDSDDGKAATVSAEISGMPVQEPQFGREVVRMFENRSNPIIHSKANRKTAIDMIMQIYKPWIHSMEC